MDQQQFGSFLRAPPYKSSGRDVIYVPRYYEEKSSKVREKKVEMAAHTVARAASIAPLSGLRTSGILEGCRRGGCKH